MTYPISDHFDGKKFRNPSGTEPKGLGAVLKWQLATAGKKPWPKTMANTAHPQVATHVAPGAVHVTFVNHATFLWQFASLNVLTDPVYSERLSPVSFAGPKRVRPPGLMWEQLPEIDLVLVSHNHYDHLDIETLVKLNERFRPAFVVPLGNRKYLQKRGIENVLELDWWQQESVAGRRRASAGAPGSSVDSSAVSSPVSSPVSSASRSRGDDATAVSVRLVPAQHWSARGPFDRNEALWGGFVIEADGVRAYFCGDSGYGAHFKEIAERAGPLDLACLPIGAYEPRWFMSDQHMNPDDAVRAHLDLRAGRSLAFHYGTFRLTDEAIDDPVKDLAIALDAHRVSREKFVALETGETTVIQTAR